MAKTTKTSVRSSDIHIIGGDSFSKISAIESIRTSPRLDKDFKEFDR